jgi:hypothetical protein
LRSSRRSLAIGRRRDSTCHGPCPSLILGDTMSSQKLSEWFAEQLRDMDEACGEKPGDTNELVRDERKMVAALEGFSEDVPASLIAIRQKYDRGTLEYWLDDYYVRRFLREAPKIVQRTMQLDPLGAKSLPPSKVNFYVREATRCFVYGFSAASVILSRAALEQGLRERVSAASGVSASRYELSQLVENARRLRLADAATLDMAEEVRVTGNRVVHAETSSQSEAFGTLTAVRAVLLAIYGGKGPLSKLSEEC